VNRFFLPIKGNEIVFLIVFGLTLLLAGCLFSTQGPIAGTGSQGGNAIVVGRVLLPNGKAASTANFTIRRTDYLSYPEGTLNGVQEGAEGVTDNLGQYQIQTLRPGEYTLSILQGAFGIKISINISKDSAQVRLATDSLKPMGGIRGKIVWPSLPTAQTYVQIFGIEQATLANAITGAFEFKALPVGEYRIRAYSPAYPQLSGEATVKVGSGTTVDSPTVILKDSRAMTFGISQTGLQIQGVGFTNPIIYDNNNFSGSLDDEYLWAKFSLGARLVGIIASRNFSSDTSNHSDLASTYAEALASTETARKSGILGLPTPFMGANAIMTPKPNGSNLEFLPEENAGSRLIISEAKKATPENPLIIFVEGQPTTVANALLLDSTIADRIIVFGYEYGRANNSPETFLVAKKCRYINADLRWAGEFPISPEGITAKNDLCDSLRSHWNTVRPGSTPRWGSVSALIYYFNSSTWKNMSPMIAVSPEQYKPSSLSEMDFLHINRDDIDLPSQVKDFFQTINDPKVYGQ
jgi:hypothetical protein